MRVKDTNGGMRVRQKVSEIVGKRSNREIAIVPKAKIGERDCLH